MSGSIKGMFTPDRIVNAKVYDDLAESNRVSRNRSITIRKLQKRVAYLEEKLNAIKNLTGLHQRGRPCQDPNHQGMHLRQKKRIDHLEARLALIRSLAVISDMRVRDMRSARVSKMRRKANSVVQIDTNLSKIEEVQKEQLERASELAFQRCGIPLAQFLSERNKGAKKKGAEV